MTVIGGEHVSALFKALAVLERHGGPDFRWCPPLGGYLADRGRDSVTLTLAGNENIQVRVRWDEITHIGLSRARR